MDLNELELVSENSYSLSKEDITYFTEFNLDVINMVEINKDEVKIEFKFYKNHQ